MEIFLGSAAGAEPGCAGSCGNLEDISRSLPSPAAARNSQEGLDPPRLPASPLRSADCSRSQAAPGRQSPNYRCQTASRGVDVTAPLPAMTQSPSPGGSGACQDPQGFFSALKVTPGTFLGDEGMEEAPGALCCGHRGVEQLRGLLKGLALHTGQNSFHPSFHPGMGAVPEPGREFPGAAAQLQPLPPHLTFPISQGGRSCRRGAKPWAAPMGAPLLSSTSTEGLPALVIHGSCFLLRKVEVCILLPSSTSGKEDFFSPRYEII